jgi:hypothetical protein
MKVTHISYEEALELLGKKPVGNLRERMRLKNMRTKYKEPTSSNNSSNSWIDNRVTKESLSYDTRS